MATWQDIIKQVDMQVITGVPDTTQPGGKKIYTPQYLTASVSRKKEYKTAQFDFKGVQGSLVKRGSRSGNVYDIEIIFQGADCITIGNNFYSDADYIPPGKTFATPWTIIHPFYGSILCHPTNLSQDNSKLNLSVITGQIVETITNAGLTVTANAPDVIANQVTAYYQQSNSTYASAVPSPGTTDIQAMLNHINNVYSGISKQIADVQADVTSYYNAYNAALNVVNPAIYDTLTIAGQISSLMLEPAYFIDSVVDRLGMFGTALSILGGDVAGILAAYNTPTQGLKALYENNAGTCIAGMCMACVNNITNDYQYRPAVLSVIQQLTAAYNGYINNLVALQSLTGGEIDSYIPSSASITSLQLLVNYTISQLYQISAGAKTQKTYTLPYDDNLINVAYKLYGADPDDSLKQTMIANNNIGLNEILVLKKGRQIIYYV